jgi:hypothetical protein
MKSSIAAVNAPVMIPSKTVESIYTCTCTIVEYQGTLVELSISTPYSILYLTGQCSIESKTTRKLVLLLIPKKDTTVQYCRAVFYHNNNV